jgi:hypothetical protein
VTTKLIGEYSDRRALGLIVTELVSNGLLFMVGTGKNYAEMITSTFPTEIVPDFA